MPCVPKPTVWSPPRATQSRFNHRIDPSGSELRGPGGHPGPRMVNATGDNAGSPRLPDDADWPPAGCCPTSMSSMQPTDERVTLCQTWGGPWFPRGIITTSSASRHCCHLVTADRSASGFMRGDRAGYGSQPIRRDCTHPWQRRTAPVGRAKPGGCDACADGRARWRPGCPLRRQERERRQEPQAEAKQAQQPTTRTRRFLRR